jgi:hypothetical protein
MSRHAGGWKLKHVIASVGATIVLCGAVAVPAIVSHTANPPAAASLTKKAPVTIWKHPAPTPTSPSWENNWG